MSGDDDYEIPENGAVFTFGRSRFAENLPSHFFVRNDPVEEISCGDDHTALVCKSGRVFLFGRNDYGQLGFGHTKDVSKPSCLKYLKPFHSEHVACGKSHTIIATACNRIFTFGCNSDGQLGIGDLTDRTVPQMVQIDIQEGDGILSVAAGCHHTGFLTKNGDVYMWGSNSDRQSGASDDSCLLTPFKIDFSQPISSLSCGYYHTAFLSDGHIYTFGEEDSGKLGRSTKSSNYGPEKVELEEKCVLVKCGGSHTLALTENGNVYGFGSNFSGQLGIKLLEAECSSPTPVEFPQNLKIVSLSCGESHSAFVTEDGFLYTCGDSRYGKLCNEDDSTNLMSPTLISSLEKYFCTFASCGGCHTMVLAKVRDTEGISGFTSPHKIQELPPLKTKKDLEDLKPTNEENEEKEEDKNEEISIKSKSNSESNLINEELNNQLDDIYTEIEEMVTEKKESQMSQTEIFKESFESNETEPVVVEKVSAVKKLMAVFKTSKPPTATVVSEESEQKVSGKKRKEEDKSYQTGNQKNSKTCTVL